jgi:hypothetical protein
MIRSFGAAALLCAAACAHSNTTSFDVRATTSGRGRAFEFDPQRGELIAWSANGKLLQLWVHPGELEVVGTGSRRTIQEGCRAGFLTRPVSQGNDVVVEIHLCPLKRTAEGWMRWHADFELHADTDVPGTLPPKAEFALLWDNDLHQLQIASQVMRASMVVPDDQWAAPIRSYPELFGLCVLLGVVPFAPDGRYDAR